MTPTAPRPHAAPQQPLSAASRIVTAIAVAAVTAVAWLAAEQASHQAVEAATVAISAGAKHVTLPAVQVVGRRDAAAVKRI